MDFKEFAVGSYASCTLFLQFTVVSLSLSPSLSLPLSLFQVSNFRSDGSPSYNNEPVNNTTDLNLLWHYYRYSLTSLCASIAHGTTRRACVRLGTRYAVELEYIGIRVNTSLVISWKLSRDPAINPLYMAYQGLIITLSISLYIYIHVHYAVA